MVPSLLYLRSWQLCVRSVKLFSLCSLATGDEEDDQEGPEEDEEEEDGSASDDSDQMLDVERKAREIDRDRFTTHLLQTYPLRRTAAFQNFRSATYWLSVTSFTYCI